jgi:hypothetical protein
MCYFTFFCQEVVLPGCCFDRMCFARMCFGRMCFASMSGFVLPGYVVVYLKNIYIYMCICIYVYSCSPEQSRVQYLLVATKKKVLTLSQPSK